MSKTSEDLSKHEELLEHIEKDLPNLGVWRLKIQHPKTKPKDGTAPEMVEVLKSRADLLVAILKMQKAGMVDKDITDIVQDMFYNAYAERDIQLKERTGMTAKEVVKFVEDHKPAQLQIEDNKEPQLA
jgi:hypothetical protein